MGCNDVKNVKKFFTFCGFLTFFSCCLLFRVLPIVMEEDASGTEGATWNVINPAPAGLGLPLKGPGDSESSHEPAGDGTARRRRWPGVEPFPYFLFDSVSICVFRQILAEGVGHLRGHAPK